MTAALKSWYRWSSNRSTSLRMLFDMASNSSCAFSTRCSSWQFTTKQVNSTLTCTAVLKTHAHTHTRLTALCPGLPVWAGNSKVKPIWIFLRQETVSGSDISWAMFKSASRTRQITMPVLHHSFFTGAIPSELTAPHPHNPPGKIMEAETPTVPVDATPTETNGAPQPPYYTGCPSCRLTLPIYPGLGQASIYAGLHTRWLVN